MSVRSVDVQNAIARTHEAERIQRMQEHVAKTGQQTFADELSRRAEETSHQVTSSPRAEEEKIRDEKERRGRGSRDTPEGRARRTPRGTIARTSPAGDGDAGMQQGSESRSDETAIPGRIIDVEV